MKPTTHLQIVPRPRQRGSIHPLTKRLPGVVFYELCTAATLSLHLTRRLMKPTHSARKHPCWPTPDYLTCNIYLFSVNRGVGWICCFPIISFHLYHWEQLCTRQLLVQTSNKPASFIIIRRSDHCTRREGYCLTHCPFILHDVTRLTCL
jgi:hypothetical protein